MIDAPSTGLASPDSGLNVALRKLGAVDRMLRQVEGNYSKLLNTINRNPFPGRTGGSGQAFMGQQRLFDPAPVRPVQTSATHTAPVSGRVELPISAEHIVAFVTGGRIPLAIHASQIDATVTGGVKGRTAGATSTGGGGKGADIPAAGIPLPNEREDMRLIKQRADKAGKLYSQEFEKANSEARERHKVQHLEGGGTATVVEKDFEVRRKEAQRQREAQLAEEDKAYAQRRKKLSSQAKDSRALAFKLIEEDEAYKRQRIKKATAIEVSSYDEQRAADVKARGRRGFQEKYGYNPEQAAGVGKENRDFLKRLSDSKKVYAQLEKEQERFNRSQSYIGKNLVQNVQHVTAWTASVAVLYGGLRLVNYSLSQYIELQYQTARLQQVLRSGWEDSAGAARRLAEEVLFLAANTGRSSKEAMEAAISWARLGLSKPEVRTATAGSLLLANVGEISASKATEHLSSLMAVYKLRVADLSGVIGAANDISNKWRITNEQMFNGLTRTASVAKQAGIPLVELMGIIGAGVGETGQSGPNLGNAIKSMIGSLANPEVQKFLREGFGVESTENGAGMKQMPELLSEIFVAYQRMTQAEKQSMVFGAVGKNQASRVAAILDSYVKGQVLAISALLNLNSAEKENEKIRETMKSQLQSLSTEWDKFVLALGNKGPAAALTDTAKALRALLAVFDGPKMSGVAAGLLGLGTAISAKLLLTSFQAGKQGPKGGILANTARAFGTIPSDLAALGNEALLRGSIFGGVGGVKGTKASFKYEGFAEGAGGLRRVAVEGKSAEQALMGMSRGAKFARLSLLAMTDVVLPLAVLWGVFKLIESGAEAFGFTSNAASENVDKLEKSALAARSAIEATGMQLRLLNTTQRALQNTSSQQARIGLIANLPDALIPDEGDDTDKQIAKKKELRAAMRLQLESIEKIGDSEKRNAAREKFNSEQAASLIVRRTQKRREENRDALAQIDTWQREIRRLQKSPFDQRENIKETQGKIESLRGGQITKLIDDVQDQDTSREEFERNSTAHQAFLARQKAIVESIRDIWTSMPGETHLDRLNKELIANESILDVLREQQKVTLEKLKNRGISEETAGLTGEEAKIAEIEARKLAIRKKFSKDTGFYSGNAGFWSGIGMDTFSEAIAGPDDTYPPAEERGIKSVAENPGPFPKEVKEKFKQQAREALEALKQADAEMEALRTQHEAKAKVHGEKGGQELFSQYFGNQKQISEAEKRRVELETMRQNKMHQDRIELATKLGTSEGESFAVGDDRAEQLQNTISGLKKSIAEKEDFARQNRFAIPGPGNSIAERDRQTEVALVEAMQQRKMLAEAIFKGQEMLNDAHKEELNLMQQKTREYQRSLLTAGPGELLRKLAVNQLSSKGLNAGGFFSLDVNARNDVLSLPQNDEQVKKLRREQDRLRSLGYKLPGEEGYTEKPLFDEQTNAGNDRNRLYGSVKDLLPDKFFEINDAAREAANGLGIAGRAAGDLAGKLDALGARVDRLFPGGNGNAPTPRAQNNPN